MRLRILNFVKNPLWARVLIMFEPLLGSSQMETILGSQVAADSQCSIEAELIPKHSQHGGPTYMWA